MNMKPFVFVLVLSAVSASAQTADVQEFRAKIQSAKADDAYAKSVVCDGIPNDAEMGSRVKFYTGLNGVGPRENLPEEGKGSAAVHADSKAPTDETRLDDYASQSVTRSKLHVDQWSCDTQDYFLTFDMDGLVRSSQKTQSQPVKGHARVETRGQVDFDGDLSCTAYW
jgi:hypothetical protein